jgi:glutamate-ammonia-ligase adenylyltransferase
MTRDGNLYRVDLRLRPYGSKGMSAISGESFINYIRDTAAVWEMLAFVKLRAVGGYQELGSRIESETRRTIHERAAALNGAELAAETLRVRLALQKQRARLRRGTDVDIKYGSGGMLDIYFAMRYLQLRDDVPDDADDRSTGYMLERLFRSGSLTEGEYYGLLNGYRFLTDLDHNLRLTVGRTP